MFWGEGILMIIVGIGEEGDEIGFGCNVDFGKFICCCIEDNNIFVMDV